MEAGALSISLSRLSSRRQSLAIADSSMLRIVVTGLIAQYPLGGMAWHYLQYVLGLVRLGHDVYYLEDTGLWPYNPSEKGLSKGCEFNVGYLNELMSHFGLGDRWAYRFPWQDQWFGMKESKRKEVLRSADLLLNVSGTLSRPDEYRSVKRLSYIDSDPVFTQLKLARGQTDFQRLVDAHDVHFSFGEALPGDTPDTGHRWIATRQPVVLSEWRTQEQPRRVFTTVMNWSSYSPVRHNGQEYGQKDVEFRKYLDLPARVSPVKLEVALNIAGKKADAPVNAIRKSGWSIVDPAAICPDVNGYRRYIQSSMAEWSVAKNGYVKGRAGWFSCRFDPAPGRCDT